MATLVEGAGPGRSWPDVAAWDEVQGCSLDEASEESSSLCNWVGVGGETGQLIAQKSTRLRPLAAFSRPREE